MYLYIYVYIWTCEYIFGYILKRTQNDVDASTIFENFPSIET